MSTSNGCLICGEELVYSQKQENLQCVFCGNHFTETVKCPEGHYICDSCHSSGAMDIISAFCRTSTLSDPVEMANIIMKHPQVKMHGPEHHFLVPAILLAAYYNHTGEVHIKGVKLDLARQRAEKIPGGFCGSHGNCGAGVGSGVFFSIITATTPLSEKTWQLSNLLTGTCLVEIAKKGGPRCCKRDTYTAITHAVQFVKENLHIEIPTSQKIVCSFHDSNKQCLGKKCEYFGA